MNVFIRVDASIEIGTGHVMRCLTLANQLRKEGKNVFFICRRADGDCSSLIKEKGFKLIYLPFIEGSLWKYIEKNWELDAEQSIDILKKYQVCQLIIDHYSIDKKWEQQVRAYADEIMIIDDLANRPHDCDILLDQNFYKDMESRYKYLVPKHTLLLLGPRYALLRDEFIEAKSNIKPFKKNIERLFIFFGGSDPTNETEKVLHAIMPLMKRYNIQVDIVVGNSNPKRTYIKQLCKNIQGANFYCQINNISELMVNADIAIGAGGVSTWERVYLELPTIVIAVAQNQIEVASALSTTNSIIYLGESHSLKEEDIQKTVEYIFENPYELQKMRQNCRLLM